MTNGIVYLDYNGTTPLDPEVVAAMEPFISTHFGNPSSGHWYGIEPKRAVEKARRQVAGLIGCAPEEVIFTSGGTESNNHAIIGAAMANRDRGTHIITTAVEHPAVLEVCRYLEIQGFSTTVLPVDEFGRVDPADVEAAISPKTVLITVMHANNEVGTLEPIEEISAIARSRRILFHTDAAQSTGKVETDVNRLGVDLLSIAGHKLYAPKGIGALFIRNSTNILKFMHGAGQEKGRRGGTENVMMIAALGMACEIAGRDLPQNRTRMMETAGRLAGRIFEAFPGAKRNGHPEIHLPNTLSVSFPGFEANRILEEIGLEVAASAGAACHADTVELSHVLVAMDAPVETAKGTVRFSTGRYTTFEEIDRAAEALIAALNRLSTERSSKE